MFHQEPRHGIFLLLLLLQLHAICTTSTASEDHHHRHHHQQHQRRLLFMFSSSRRILHEPLFPITYTPPPPPQALPPPNPSSDWPFFPQPPPQPTTPPTTNAASLPARPNAHASSSSDQLAETITVAVSAAVGALVVLAGLVFIVRRHLRARRSKAAESDKLFGHESRRPSEAEGPTIASRFLYLGTMEPSGEGDGEGRRSPHHKLASISRAQGHRPSPELQPLPPLSKAGRWSSPPVFSDEEEGETVYYSPNCSSIAGSTSSATTNTTARSRHYPSTSAYSCRTSPKSRLSRSSSLDAKTIPSPTQHSSPPSPPPALPFPPARRAADAAKLPALPSKREPVPPPLPPQPPPPPVPPSLLKNYTGRFSGGRPPPPLPPPPPPPPPPLPTQTKIESLGAPSGITGQLPALSNGTDTGDLSEEKLLHSMKVEESLDEERPRLKPLHWDKVRAPSDRATVWDQFKSSSFP